jgi:D-hexose-6-phosphate mutarotase
MANIVVEKFPDSVVLKHSSGSTVKILYYGATVISWTLANGAENLFLSE